MLSRLPRAAGLPYSAHAIASSSVDLPEPLGPMMPVRPPSNVRAVSRAGGNSASRSAISRIRRPSPAWRRSTASSACCRYRSPSVTSCSRSMPGGSTRSCSRSARISGNVARRPGAPSPVRLPHERFRPTGVEVKVHARACDTRAARRDRVRARRDAARCARRPAPRDHRCHPAPCRRAPAARRPARPPPCPTASMGSRSSSGREGGTGWKRCAPERDRAR